MLKFWEKAKILIDFLNFQAEEKNWKQFALKNERASRKNFQGASNLRSIHYFRRSVITFSMIGYNVFLTL